ncbi:MAG: hypothetical protein WC635_09730 [Bacteriovorax sp.]|jgi:hypothetical protein
MNISSLTLTIKKKKLLDIFIIANFFFLTFDIIYAHSINRFEHWGEWIPLILCVFATIILGINFFLERRFKSYITIFFGSVSLFVGVYGAVFHLDSQFFQAQSIKSLIYTAPFVAPLSFSALGLLLFLNLMVSSMGRDWGRWIIWFSYLGFLGNYILSLCDHEQNGFYYVSEWIPVVSSSLVIGFIPYFISPNRSNFIYKSCYILVATQFIVGFMGAIIHLQSILRYSNVHETFIEKIRYGAPIMAPLLFCNLALLMFIGMRAYESDDKYVYFDLNRK